MVCHFISSLVLTTASVAAFDICGPEIKKHYAFPSPHVKWAIPTVEIRLQFGEPWNSIFLDAANEWNSKMRDVQIVGIVSEDGEGGDRDGINQGFFSPDIYGNPFGFSAAQVRYWYRGNLTLSEADLIFNTAYIWGSYHGPRTAEPLDFRRTALHEIGHLLGLTHPNDQGQEVQAIMNNPVTIENLTQDDISGIQFIYGVPDPDPISLSYSFGMTIYGPVFQFRGEPNRFIFLLRSVDLKNWSTVSRIENPTGDVSLLDQLAPPGRCFYRAFYE